MTLDHHIFPEGYVLLRQGHRRIIVYAPWPSLVKIAERGDDCTDVEALLWAQNEITRWSAQR